MKNNNFIYKLVFTILVSFCSIFAMYEVYEGMFISAFIFFSIAILMARKNYWIMIAIKYFLYLATIVVAGGILNPFFFAEIQKNSHIDEKPLFFILLSCVIFIEGLLFLLIKFINTFEEKFPRRLL